MLMLMCRSAGHNADGSKRRMPLVRERARKFGPVLSEKPISVRRDVLIVGPNASGKTRWLDKLAAHGADLWQKKEVLYLRAVEPLQQWVEDPRVVAHVKAQGREWQRLRQFERVEALAEWIKTGVVLVFDDVHKLAGRKLDLALRMARDCAVFVAGAWSEQSIPMSLRMLIDRRDPQRVHLSSDAAYDATTVLMWLFMLSTIAVGWWELAAVVGATKVLAGGRRAAKQA